jgi:hypothetical protein
MSTKTPPLLKCPPEVRYMIFDLLISEPHTITFNFQEPTQPTQRQNTSTSASGATSEELSFFDRAKKFIANTSDMNKFLKLCKLFSQDLIDRNALVHKASSFISRSPDLMNWFKLFVGYEDVEEFGPLHSLEKSCTQLKDEIHTWLPSRPHLTVTAEFGIFDPEITIFDFVCIIEQTPSVMAHISDNPNWIRREIPDDMEYEQAYLQQPTPTEIRRCVFWKECCKEAGTNDLAVVTEVIVSRLHEPEVRDLLRDIMHEYAEWLPEKWHAKKWYFLIPDPRFVCGDYHSGSRMWNVVFDCFFKYGWPNAYYL